MISIEIQRVTGAIFLLTLSPLSQFQGGRLQSMYKPLIDYGCQNVGHSQSVGLPICTASQALRIHWGGAWGRDRVPAHGKLTGVLTWGKSDNKHKIISESYRAVKKIESSNRVE
jgi:hypothetical protein